MINKNKGFTVLELVIAIAVLGLVLGMMFESYARTNKIKTTGENKLEYIREMLPIIELLSSDFRRLTAEHPVRFDGNTGSFWVRREMKTSRVTISGLSQQACVISHDNSASGEPVSRSYPGNLIIEFWNGSNWSNQWQEDSPPKIARITIADAEFAKRSVDPFSLLVSIPAGMIKTNPIMEDGPEL
ncbi:prepilin-type N-terminal cleavage/methylation domain-containing protein [bacterium]|nr:prepilin-type N-terminal cleavage/methylation domain-containing protein [candidate division CSSED10-310 bacterium]